MVSIPETNQQSLSANDLEELTKLVNAVALSEKSRTLFAIAPDSGPSHPVTEAFAAQLKQTLDEPLQFQTFFYSDNSLFNFLATLDAQAPLEAGRRIVFAFGLEHLPKPRLKQELEQLNLGREKIFGQNLVLIFWLNQERFLDEFRDRAPDFWDWRGQVALFKQRHPFLYPYLEWLIAENSYLTMSGIMQVNRQVDIFLDQIYVSLQAERRQQVTVTSKHQQVSASKVTDQRQFGQVNKGSALEPNSMAEPVLGIERTELELETGSTKTVTEKVDLADVVRGPYACSVILGAPGAGKTTLLKHLALQFAKARRDNQETVQGGTKQEESLGQPRWPVYLRIADYAERLESYPELSIMDYLKRFYRGWEEHFDSGDALDLVTPLLNRMEQGQCLILLDGLDEVFDQESRRKIVGCINQFAEEFNHNKLIVTSRIAGYQEVKLASRFTEFTITDMTDEQVSEFLYRWCRAVEQAQKSEAIPEQQERAGNRQAEQILSDIQRNEGVRRLTANPLLLTILALIHRNGERLPERRVKLYELAVQTLTADWQLHKKLPNAQKVLLPEGEVVELLAPLAYWMHEEKPSGQVTHNEVIKQLAPRLAELRGEEPNSPEILAAVEEFLRRVRETTGLFVEKAPDVYGFMHLTFEEYFAARDIADKDPSEILDAIQSHWCEPRWAEPILLAVGYYGAYSPRQMNRLFERLFKPLRAYQPQIGRDIVKLLGNDSQKAKLLWTKSDHSEDEAEFSLQELLFAGQIIAQVAEVNANARKKLISQLLTTKFILADEPDDAEKLVIKQILQLLRQIEQFHCQGEVVKALETVIKDTELSKEMQLKAQVVKLYVLCGEAGAGLAEYTTELAEAIESDLFCAFRELVDSLGAEMSPALESIRHQLEFSEKQQALTFITAMTCMRTTYYQKAIELFEELINAENSLLSPYVAWSMAICHGERWNYDEANDFYQSCYESLTECAEYWKDRGKFQQSHTKYEKALNCFQQMLAITDNLHNLQKKALAFDYLGKVHKASRNYKDAIHCHNQSLELYQQLEKEANMANQLSNIADCYSKWKRYKKALESQQQALEICQKRIDQLAVSLNYCQLGDIYQAWDKYEEAICCYEQSRNLYQQLGKDSDVANQWLHIAECNCKWGHYEQALSDYQQVLDIKYEYHGFVYSWGGLTLSNICKADGKYREAIDFHEQTRDFCQKLRKESNIASEWSYIADCYREWGHYEQALAAQQQALIIRQKLDDQSAIALTYRRLGRIYQAWGKYEEAIQFHEQSRDLYRQLEKESDIASEWSYIADCYREWGHNEQALAAQQQALVIRQKLDDQSAIALTYYQLGRIYQAWDKYEEAIQFHEQSRDLYRQLEKESSVANLWSHIAECYRQWGHYKQALAAQQQALVIRQKLDDQSTIALTYYQLGRIYQAWDKYEEAIQFHEQSRDIEQQLEKDSNVASLWLWIAECYREWGRYNQALAAQQQSLTIRQKLGGNQSAIAVVYCQLGRIHQTWGKYEEAIQFHEQSRDIEQQLEKDSNVAILWYWIAECYREWGRYNQALAAQQRGLAIRQKLGDQSAIALTYYQLGRIHQTWDKYEEAIQFHEQSCDIEQQLEKDSNVASQWYWIAQCYCELGDYLTSSKCYRKSFNQHQAIGDFKRTARGLRFLAYTQSLQAKNGKPEEANALLQQADQNLQQAIQLNIAGDYRENLAYDHIIKALLIAGHIRKFPQNDNSISNRIAQFEQATTEGLNRFAKLGQAVSSAEETLKIARIYLEIKPLRDLNKAEDLAQQSLQTFQQFNRPKLQAETNKLLGEIYLARIHKQEPNADIKAKEFLTASLSLYQELDIFSKSAEVEQLLAQ